MCFASPMAQVTPSNPAPYPVDESYGTVTSNTITPDGVTHGGATIAQQYQANLAKYGQATPPNAVDDAKAPSINTSSSTTSTRSGATYRM